MKSTSAFAPSGAAVAICFASLLMSGNPTEADDRLATVRLLRGDTFVVQPESIGESRITWRGTMGERAIGFDDLFSWGVLRETGAGTVILLHDGSRIAADVTAIDDNEIAFISTKRSGIWSKNRLPREDVRGILFAGLWSPVDREREEFDLLQRCRDATGLITSEGDLIRGALLSAGKMPGVKDADPFRIRFQPEGGSPVELKADRMRGILFPEKKIVSAVRDGFWLGLTDGSCVRAKDIEGDAGHIELTLFSGTTLQLGKPDRAFTQPSSSLAHICFLQRISSGFHYVSDLPVIGYKHVPFFTRQLPYSVDRNPDGSALRARGVKYAKGIRVPSTSRLAYDIPTGMRLFASSVALLDDAEGTGSVKFGVFLENASGQWEVATEKRVTGRDEPILLTVPLEDAQRIALVVEMDTRGDVLDHACWLDARLLP